MDGTDDEEYRASDIVSLTPHEHLLKRMLLTFGPIESAGDTASAQKGVAVREILDNGLDEIRGGHGTHLRLTFHADRSFTVQDSGRGIPPDVGVGSDGTRMSGIVLAMSVLQAGGKFATDSKRYSSGLNGVGGSAVCHVSSRMDVTVARDGHLYAISFREGVPGRFSGDGPHAPFTALTDLTDLDVSSDRRPAAEKTTYPTGTTVRCWLNDQVFSSPYPYDDVDIIDRLHATCFLVPTLYAEVSDELAAPTDGGGVRTEQFHCPGGLASLVDATAPDQGLCDTITFGGAHTYTERAVPVLTDHGVVPRDVERTVLIDVAMRWGEGFEQTTTSFVNTIRTKLGGVHEDAFTKALVTRFTKAFTSMRGLLGPKDTPPVAEDFGEGLTVVLSVQVSEPSFTSQSKEELSGTEVYRAVLAGVGDMCATWCADRHNTAQLRIIGQKVCAAAKNRQRAREQRDINRKKNALSASSLPTKLVDCERAGTDDAELYICEGNSAATAIKEARDGMYNALLPVRGKIINARKHTLKKVLENTEVQDIITALGAGIGADFDMDRMRYGRVIVAADADPDGNAIACLIFALFYYLFRPVVTEGRLYKVEPPLFVITEDRGNKTKGPARRHYAHDDADRDRIVARLESHHIHYKMSRLKGLGEMRASTLRETALNPDTRIITRVTCKDMDRVARSMELVFGEDTDRRKQWIESADVDPSDLEG